MVGLTEGLADEFFAFLPESFRIFAVEGVTANAFADGSDDRVARYDLPDMAVFAVLAADFVGGSDDAGPDGSCSALRNGLPLERTLAFGGELLVDLINQRLHAAGVYVAAEFSGNGAGMDRGGPNAARAMAPVKFNGEEDVGCLGAAIGDEGFIGCSLEIWIVEVYVRKAVAGGREIDQAAACAKQGRDAVDENEVAEVIGAELRLEAVARLRKRRGHDSGIGDDQVEGLAFSHEPIGTEADAFEAGEIEFDELEAAAVAFGVVADLRSGRPSFRQVARCADYLCAMRSKGAGGLHAESGGSACNQDAFAAQINAGEDFFGCRRCSKCVCHCVLLQACYGG